MSDSLFFKKSESTTLTNSYNSMRNGSENMSNSKIVFVMYDVKKVTDSYEHRPIGAVQNRTSSLFIKKKSSFYVIIIILLKLFSK